MSLVMSEEATPGHIDDEESKNISSSTGRKCCCSKLCSLFVTALTLLVISVIMSIGTGVTYYLHEELFIFVVNKEMSLTKASLLTPIWADLGPQNTSIYYFNITNAYEVQHKGAIPNVQEVGPFHYIKRSIADNIYWNKEETLLSYRRHKSYEDAAVSAGLDPRQIKVTSLNVPLIGLLHLLENIETSPKYKEWKLVLDAIFETADWINELLKYESLFITKTIDELSWGYEDPLFKLIHELDPTLLPKSNFSLQSKSKVYTYNVVYTGKNDSKLRSQFVIWNGLSEISEWNTPTARMINGTDASVFHTNLLRNEKITSFTDDFKRSAYFVYDKDELVDSLLSFRYVFSKDEMNTSVIDPGFYPDGPSGVLNLSAVEPFGLPLFVSKPHFLDADVQFGKNVTGLHPNRTLHDSSLNVEPVTGITISGVKRIQVNVGLTQRKGYKQLKHLRPLTVLPLFYVVDSANIADDQADKLHTILKYVEGSMNVGLPILIGVTGSVALFALVCLIILALRMTQRPQTVQRVNEPSMSEQTPLLQ